MPRLEDIPPELVADAVAKAVVEAVAVGGDADAVVSRALARVKGELGLNPGEGVRQGQEAPSRARAPQPAGNGYRPAPIGSGKSIGTRTNGGRPLLTESDVLGAARSGRREMRLSPGTIVTALARDAARDAGVTLVED